MSNISKSTKTESTLVFDIDRGREEWKVNGNGYGLSSGCDENTLELDTSDGYTTL